MLVLNLVVEGPPLDSSSPTPEAASRSPNWCTGNATEGWPLGGVAVAAPTQSPRRVICGTDRGSDVLHQHGEVMRVAGKRREAEAPREARRGFVLGVDDDGPSPNLVGCRGAAGEGVAQEGTTCAVTVLGSIEAEAGEEQYRDGTVGRKAPPEPGGGLVPFDGVRGHGGEADHPESGVTSRTDRPPRLARYRGSLVARPRS